MKLLGSSIFVTSAFCSLGGEFTEYIGLTPLLCLNDTVEHRFFQDGMFHKKRHEKLEKLRMDRGKQL